MVTVWLLYGYCSVIWAQIAKKPGKNACGNEMVTVGTGFIFRWFGVPGPIKHDNSERQQQMLQQRSSGIVVFYRVWDSEPPQKWAGVNSNHTVTTYF